MGKMVNIYDKHKNLIGAVDYEGFLDFRLSIIRGERESPCYVQNDHGGLDEIDEHGIIQHKIWPFGHIDEKLKQIILAQMEKRKGKRNDTN